MKKVQMLLHKALASHWTWRAILAIFIFSSLWIAFSSVYPMAFDEEFHLGVIKLYAEQWSPFLRDLSSNAAQFGAIGQDPSYLYHYLISFPYRLLATFLPNEAVVIVLRILNIAIVVTALIIFRKAFRRAGLGRGSANVLIAVFALIPISPLLAGQINYDNLLLLLIACLALQVQPLIASIGKKQFPIETVLMILIICLVASIVKYAFLPIFAATILFLASYTFFVFRRDSRKIPKLLAASWRKITLSRRIILISVLTLLLLLVGQRYVVNAVVYHSPIPNCSKVFSDEACMQYGPWKRDYNLENEKITNNVVVDANPITYSMSWFYGMWYRLFFMISGYNYQNFSPLPILGFGAIVLFVSALLIFLFSLRRTLAGKPVYWLYLLISGIYVAALWYQNYTAYLRTGDVVAVNGRYLLLILPLAGVPIIAAVSHFLAKRRALYTFAVILTLIVFLQGGGLSSFIVRGNENWYWNNTPVQSINKAADDILSPVIVGSESTLPIPSP